MTAATKIFNMTFRIPNFLYDSRNENVLNDSGKLNFLYENANEISLYDSRNKHVFNDSSK